MAWIMSKYLDFIFIWKAKANPTMLLSRQLFPFTESMIYGLSIVGCSGDAPRLHLSEPVRTAHV